VSRSLRFLTVCRRFRVRASGFALRTDLAVDWLFASCGTFEQATVYRRRMNHLGEWEAVLSEPGMGRTTLAVAPSNQRVVYALSASNNAGPHDHFEQALLAVYRSTAGGNPDRLYLGTNLGVFTTINGGRTWAVENNGFANVVTEWLTLGTDDDGEPWLFAFTHGRGAFKVRLKPLPAAPRESAGRRTP
jgi:hypothetical protein